MSFLFHLTYIYTTYTRPNKNYQPHSSWHNKATVSTRYWDFLWQPNDEQAIPCWCSLDCYTVYMCMNRIKSTMSDYRLRGDICTAAIHLLNQSENHWFNTSLKSHWSVIHCAFSNLYFSIGRTLKIVIASLNALFLENKLRLFFREPAL